MRTRGAGSRRGADGGTSVVALRHAPDGGEEVLLVANLEGDPWTVVPSNLLEDVLEASGWRVSVASPGAPVASGEIFDPHRAMVLRDAQGLLAVRAF